MIYPSISKDCGDTEDIDLPKGEIEGRSGSASGRALREESGFPLFEGPPDISHPRR